MQSSRFQSARLRAKPEYKINIKKNLAVIEQIYAILDEKDWTQKQLASALEKSESEISKWLSGTHNLTLLTISKIESVLGAEILITPKQAHERVFNIDQIKVNSTVLTDHFYTNLAPSAQRVSRILVGGNIIGRPITGRNNYPAKWAQVEQKFNNKKAPSNINVEEEHSGFAA